MGWLVIGLVSLPFVVAAADLLLNASPKPAIDYALMELHTRDVGVHWVLVGAWSRFHWNHPGPALYYLLAGPYRLFGGQYSGLEIGALLLNWICAAGTVAIARRRGGAACAWITAVLVLVLMRSLSDVLRSPWNADVPVLGLLLLILLAWTITCGDVKLLPVGFGVASALIQTHVGYTILAVTLMLWAVVGALLLRRQAGEGSEELSFSRPALWSGVVLAVMWLPPVADELFGTGNLSSLWRFFTSDHSGHSLSYSWHAVADQLSLVPEWVTGARPTPFFGGIPVNGAAPIPVALIGTLVALVVAWRRSPVVRSLAITALLCIVAAVVSMSRVTGVAFPWLVRFVWVVGMVAWVVTLWGIAEALGWLRGRGTLIASMAALVFALGLAGWVAVDQTEVPAPASDALLRDLMTPAVRRAVSGQGDVFVGALRADGPAAQADYYGSPGADDILEHWGVPVRVARKWEWLYGSDRAKGRQGARMQLLIVPAISVQAVASTTGCLAFTSNQDAALFLRRLDGDHPPRCVAPPPRA